MIESQTVSTSSSTPNQLTSHKADTLRSWERVNSLAHDEHLNLDGQSLDISSLIAVAREGCAARISGDPKVSERVLASVQTLNEYLSKDYCIYGVNTGFGGSADTRTTDVVKLQQSLLQHTQSGILTENDFSPHRGNYYLGFHSLPAAWVRATMIVRCNHLLRGHSGVRLEIVEAILKLVSKGLTPIIPLRGSISASGDLMPLSYIAGVLEGNPDIQVRWERRADDFVVSARQALEIAGISPFILGPKEGLGLINGAAASAAVGSLAASETSQLIILAQGLSAMTCEALLGNAENYHEFVSQIRPHPGQAEVATNIREWLEGSQLVETSAAKDHFREGLFQDRYALRSASQWLGPSLEDLELSIKQLTQELNSTQDNPVIDTQSGEMYFCGNFQAASVSLAAEKMRTTLQMIGKLLFSYSSELINPDLNKGLPANLAADDPSLSFTMKGIDVNMASYMSELAFLANSVTSHVQSAEMHNQPINSLALISGRYTMQAAEIVSMMSAAHLYVVCQALDLRVLHQSFLKALDEIAHSATREAFNNMETESLEKLQKDLTKTLRHSWASSTRSDLPDRIKSLSDSIAARLMSAAKDQTIDDPITTIETVQNRICSEGKKIFESMRSQSFLGELGTESWLGTISKSLYLFVRRDLGVPFHCGLWENPTSDSQEENMPQRPRKTIGTWVSKIYEAIRDRRIQQPLKA